MVTRRTAGTTAAPLSGDIFVVVLGKLTMDVSRGFGGKFTRMCFGSGISSSTELQRDLYILYG